MSLQQLHHRLGRIHADYCLVIIFLSLEFLCVLLNGYQRDKSNKHEGNRQVTSITRTDNVKSISFHETGYKQSFFLLTKVVLKWKLLDFLACQRITQIENNWIKSVLINIIKLPSHPKCLTMNGVLGHTEKILKTFNFMFFSLEFRFNKVLAV